MNQKEILDSLFISFYNRNTESIIQILSNSSFITPDFTFDDIPPKCRIYGRPPFPLLNITSTLGYLEASQMLLHNGADYDCVDGFKNSPLHCAAISGNTNLMDLLLFEYNCDPTPKNCNNDLPIHIAASFNQSEAVLYLIKNAKNKVDEKNDSGKTTLSIAVEKNNLPLVQYLINVCSSDVTTIDNNRNTLLHIAVQNKCITVLQYLLSLNKININNKNDEGFTPLLISALVGDPEIFNALLSSGACPLDLDKKGRSIIHLSIKSSSFDIFNCIIQNQLVYPFERDKSLLTSFHYAAASRDIRFIQVLGSLDGTLINDDECGFTPLHIACKHQNLEIVKFIISCPIIDPLILNKYGQSPLHIAARSSNYELFLFILSGNYYDFTVSDANGVSFYIFPFD